MKIIKFFPTRNVVYVIFGFMVSLFVFAVLYVCLGPAILEIITAIQSSLDLGDNANTLFETFKYTFMLSGIIVIIGLILWLYTNTRKREVITYEI